MEHTAVGAVGAAIQERKLTRADVGNDVYERALGAAQSEFGRHKRAATGYHNAVHAAKMELIEAMGNKKAVRHKTTRSRDADVSAYERERLEQIERNKGVLAALSSSSNSMPADAVVLWVQKHWLDKILLGDKTMEIRTNHLRKYLGCCVYLAESESRMVKATVVFTESRGPFTQTEWESHMNEHCCGKTRFYAPPKHNYGWSFKHLNILQSPIGPINRPPEAQRWQTGKW